MKYILASLLLFIAFSLAPIHAQEVTPQASQQQGGVRPSNVFFFLDRLVEEVQAFITFDPQARVRLRLEFAAERLAEVKLEIAAKNAQGLDTALTNLREQIASARTILASQQTQGSDVSVLASQAQALIESQEEELEGLVEEEIKINGTLSVLTDETITVSGITLLRSPITKIEIGVAVGSTVEVKATSQADGTLLVRKVELSDEPDLEVKVKGILSALTDTSATVAGITFVLTPQTKREGTLAVGGEVEAKAIPQEDGSLAATKIEAEEDNLEEKLKVKIKLEVDKLDDEDDKLSSLLPPRQKESKLLRESAKEAEKAAREAVKELRKVSAEASKTAGKAAKEEEKALNKQAKEEAKEEVKSLKETAKEAERRAKEADKSARETQKRSEEIRSKLEKSIKQEDQQKEEKGGNKEEKKEESKQEEEEND